MKPLKIVKNQNWNSWRNNWKSNRSTVLTMRKQKTTKREMSLCWLEKLLSGWKFNLEFRATHNTIISRKVRECFHRFTKGQRIIPQEKPWKHKAGESECGCHDKNIDWTPAQWSTLYALKVVVKTISLPFPPQQSRHCYKKKSLKSVVHQSQLCRRLTYSLVSCCHTNPHVSKNQTQSVKK